MLWTAEEPCVRRDARRRVQAFSLIEVVLALGVVSFSVVAMVGLFPVGYKNALESRQETSAAFIAQQISGDLRSSPFTNASVLYRGTDGKLAVLSSFSLTGAGTHVFACGVQNNILRELGSGVYDAPCATADTAFLARIVIVPISSGGLSRVEVEVSGPAAAASTNRSHFGFVTMMGGAS